MPTIKELLRSIIYIPMSIFAFMLLLFIGFMQWLMEDDNENS